jgi:hypothetical protein
MIAVYELIMCNISVLQGKGNVEDCWFFLKRRCLVMIINQRVDLPMK